MHVPAVEIGRAEFKMREHLVKIESGEGIKRIDESFDSAAGLRIDRTNHRLADTVPVDKLFLHEEAEIHPHRTEIFFHGLLERKRRHFVKGFVSGSVFLVQCADLSVDPFQIFPKSALAVRTEAVFRSDGH